MKKDISNPRDPKVNEATYDEFFNNRLSLPDALKKDMTDKGLDWRFINAQVFRAGGNMHRSHWRPYKIEKPETVGIMATNAEGCLQRGDLVLAVRPKAVSSKHREFLTNRNRAYAGYNKNVATELKKMARDYDVSEHVKVHEGYDEND